MTLRSVGEMIDQLVGYTYEGPVVTPADILNLEARAIGQTYRRPRLAQFTFSPYLRTPVHDLPHDGVGTVALPKASWDAMCREAMPDFPSEMNIQSVFGLAVEHW